MLTARGARISGIVALTIAVMAIASIAAAAGIRTARRHVVVQLYNVNDIEQVFVNCRQAGEQLRINREASVDLGHLRPDDLVTLQARNIDGDYTWGFIVSSNGVPVLNDQSGRFSQKPGGAGDSRHLNQIVHTRTLTASGREVGAIGTQESPRRLACSTNTSGARHEPPYRWFTWVVRTGRVAGWILAGAGALAMLLWTFERRSALPTAVVVVVVLASTLFDHGLYALALHVLRVGGALLLIGFGVKTLGLTVRVAQVGAGTTP